VISIAKIIFALNHFWPCIGGIERFAFDLSKALQDKNFNVSILTLNKCHSGEKLANFEEINGIKIFRFPFLNLKYYLLPFNWFKIYRIAKNYDIIHVHGLNFFSDFFLLTKFLHKKKVFISTHGGIFHTKKLLFLKKLYFNFWLKFILSKADKVLAVSKNDFELFSKIIDKRKILIFKDAVNLDQFEKLSKEKEKFNFLFVGRLSENKRLDLLLKSFKTVVEEIPEAKLFIVGPDWNNNLIKLKDLSKQLGLSRNVFFEGQKNDRELLNYYSKAEFFVSASEYEGFGLTLIEAMAANCIPIVNNIESFNHIIDKNTGLILNFNDLNAGKKIASFALNKEFLVQIKKEIQKKVKEYSIKERIKDYAFLVEK